MLPHRRPARSRAALVAALLTALLGAPGCTPEAAPAPAAATPVQPPGTVLLVDDLPLTAAEVEPLCRDIRALYPEYSPLHARRLALTNEFLPRRAARASAPERWREARDACERAGPELGRAGQPGGPVPMRIEGRFKNLGLGLWSAARHLPTGEWSAPLEFPGRWLRVRVESRVESDDPLLEQLTLAYFEFPYVPTEDPAGVVQAAIDRARLRLLDPEFAEAVPEAWKHRMGGSPP